MRRLGQLTALIAWIMTAAPTVWADTAAVRTDRASAWSVDIRAGTMVPAGDLKSGLLAGTELQFAPSSARWRIGVGIDWVTLRQKDMVFFKPPGYPRSRGQLIQHSDLFTGYAGGNYALFRDRIAEWYVGAAVGLSINRSRFKSFGYTKPENDAAPSVLARIGLRRTGTKLGWSLELSWRHTAHELGASEGVGESNSGGLIVTAGLLLLP